ncbi:MAG TPA: C25 family cysteine peptidase, partial [Candidatus Norongarragalinales archaeon]|nr:C25 family cysteine peptidase [Candidatus Norongarragalinales archaeon]
LIKKMSRQSLDRAHPIRVAVGRIPLPWNERSSQVLSEKLQQYANVRTKTSKETLMVVDKCGGSDCFIERETDDTKIAEEVVCSEVICKVESPEYCEGHLGKSAKTCEPLALFKRMSTADTLYFFTHGDRGLFAAQSKDQDSYTVLTAKSVIERPEIDLSKNKPVVYSDGCYSAALDVVSPKEEKGATGFSASMPLALLKKGALLYVGSTRKVPSYKEAYKNEAGRTFSPLAKYIRLTTSSKTKINRRVGDALLEAKTLAFKQALEGNPNYKLAAIGFVLYGDPTLRAVGIADQPAAVLLDGRDVTLRPSFAYAGTGCS